ncbi:putative SP-containing membrane protein [Vairimorpha necatrix]|uniref:SP-containing membrane protein n=1 Tax=Vairimorpha necatrix TaxID=6039 RepID=A0AAX4JDW3_9MICR
MNFIYLLLQNISTTKNGENKNGINKLFLNGTLDLVTSENSEKHFNEFCRGKNLKNGWLLNEFDYSEKTKISLQKKKKYATNTTAKNSQDVTINVPCTNENNTDEDTFLETVSNSTKISTNKEHNKCICLVGFCLENSLLGTFLGIIIVFLILVLLIYNFPQLFTKEK